MIRHLWPESLVIALLVVGLLVALPAACIAEAQTSPSSWSLLGRYTSSDALGYEGDAGGLALWRDHCGERLCLRSELLGTMAQKVDGSSRWAGVVTIEERLALGSQWWIGAATRWHWRDDGEGWSDQLAIGAGWTDERPDGHGQALHLRLLLPDSTTYEAQGYEVRWVSLCPRWILSLELQHVAYTLDGDREWGRRVSILAGRRWRTVAPKRRKRDPGRRRTAVPAPWITRPAAFRPLPNLHGMSAGAVFGVLASLVSRTYRENRAASLRGAA